MPRLDLFPATDHNMYYSHVSRNGASLAHVLRTCLARLRIPLLMMKFVQLDWYESNMSQTSMLHNSRAPINLRPRKRHNRVINSAMTRTKCILGLWLRLECSLDSLSIDSAHVIYVSEGYDVAYNRRTASQPSYVVLRVTWYVKTFRNLNYVC